MESRMKNWRSLHYYTENILYTLYYSTKNMYTTFLLFFFQIFKVYSMYVSSSSVAGLCLFAKEEVKNLSKVDWIFLFFFRKFLKWFRHLSSTKAQSLFISTLLVSEAAYVIRHLTSCCLERKQPNRIGGSPLCDVVSSFLCHTYTDGKDKLLEWPDRSCVLLYVRTRIH
jgi:hypothetical protein